MSSAGYEPAAGNKNPRAGGHERDQRPQHWDASKGDTRGRDINTFSNHPRMPAAGLQRPESAGNAAPTKYTGFQNTSRPQSGFSHDMPSRQPPPPLSEQALPFVTASDLQSRPLPSGRRPTGARLPTPPSGSNPVSTFEPVQPRSGKVRLNLLNPMSLLARRRTSQAIPQLSAESLAANRSNDFSATFDPRIRGTVVHDFSAPRAPPRRNVSYNDVAAAETSSNGQRQYQRSPNLQYVEANTDDNGPWSGGNHTPVFTENFEEEQYPAAGPHVRKANDLSDLPLPKPPYAKSTQKPIDKNSLAKSNKAVPKEIPPRKTSDRKPVCDVGPPVPPKVEGEVPQPRRISIDPAATPPKSNLSSRKGPSRNVSGVSAKDAALPKHMKSTSSRFSFDMIGAAEQERLLEDRHRQRALEKKNEKGDDPYDEEEEDFDYDDMMDDDGLEERIPGVNADLDDDDDLEGMLGEDDGFEESIPGVNADAEEDDEGFHNDSENFAGFTFQQSSLASPMSPYGPGMVSTPRDANGEVIGFAFTKDSPQVPQVQDSRASTPISSGARISAIGTQLQGLGLHGVEMSSPTEVHEQEASANPDVPDFPQASGIDDDDLYFDDGIIDELGEVDDGVEFDESVFDNVDTDQYGRPLKSFSSLPTLYSPPTLTTDPSPSFNKIPEADESTLKSPDVPDSAISPGTIPPTGGLVPKSSVIGTSNAFSTIAPSQVLTQDTLAAYQSALAAAAHAAAANGKFNRRDSIPTDALSPSSQIEPHPGLIPDSSQTSHYEPFSPSYELEDDFDYDDNLEDDPIIAAANAEALANDMDGFYGQEFGFYSAPAASEAEYSNGGYFGPRGVEGVMRSQSGRIASREPNLTPITERSEYSNRNSFMSLSMHGPGSVTSPGLAQLAGLMSNPEYEGDMSLNALLKLRRGAWGGSQASLHSSTGSPRSAGGAEDMSPVGGLPPWQQGGAVYPLETPGLRHRRQNSGFSIGAVSEIDISGVQSEDGSRPESPTLTMAAPLRPQSQTKNSGSSGEISVISKSEEKGGENGKGKEVRKHRYTGSAESISYLKEDDPLSPTGERWVLERRRTAESGEVEFLGREVVSGGRI